ncbi:MAG: shikimate dehydrogenase [Bifidobacteriaceae bacterium]|jgi:shikimate dehydrogenase|nr:shikimate dehydrogenase [Bifidobacteriaceae bacterium]
MTNRAAVLGSPIAHSLSPALHRAGYTALGLTDWAYEALEMTEERLGPWLAGLGPEWKGLSLTMPLKRTVLGLVDHVQPLAKLVGGANTVVFNQAGAVGANTDVHGIVAAIREARPDGWGAGRVRSASILGGGATAAAALAALAELGVRRPRVYVRSTARARPLLQAAGRMRVAPELHKLRDDAVASGWAADLTISTLPPRAADQLAGQLAGGSAASAISAGGLLLDVAYDPWPSVLATAWERAGGEVVSGKAMLLHQAAAQFQLMTGHAAPLEQMRAAIV